MDLFKEILPSINHKDSHLYDENMDDEAKSYNPFIINKALSFGTDSILYANEMNRLHYLPKKLQYDFYFYGLERRKRYNKWIKQKNINNLDIVKEYYQCSDQKAKQYLDILSKDDIKYIKRYLKK